MKPQPRLRKTVKWMGLGACVLLATVWIGSAWWLVRWTHPSGAGLCVGGGMVIFGHADPAFILHFRSGWEMYRASPKLLWWVLWESDPHGFGCGVPLWMPVVALVFATSLVWRYDAIMRHRARRGACAVCGYEMTGLAAGAVCPECGRAAGTGGTRPPLKRFP